MEKGMLTKREEELLRTLLVQRGITTYQLFEVTQEGKQLPGSTFPLEIESMSGYVITPTNVYVFWLDWVDGHYTLGEEDGTWREVATETIGRDKDRVIQIQQQMRPPLSCARRSRESNEKNEMP